MLYPSGKGRVSVTIVKRNPVFVFDKRAVAACRVKHIGAALFFGQFFKPGSLFKVNFQSAGIFDAVGHKNAGIPDCQENGNFIIGWLIKVKI